MSYSIIVDKSNQHLLDFTSIYPDPTDVFTLADLSDNRTKVSTDNKDRFDRWKKKLDSIHVDYEVVNL